MLTIGDERGLDLIRLSIEFDEKILLIARIERKCYKKKDSKIKIYFCFIPNSITLYLYTFKARTFMCNLLCLFYMLLTFLVSFFKSNVFLNYFFLQFVNEAYVAISFLNRIRPYSIF